MEHLSAIPVVGFVGYSNSGKTTLLEKLLVELNGRGYRVAVLKHTYRAGLETDIPGKDTRRLWEAGAAQTILYAPDRLVSTLRCVEEPPLAAALALVAPGADLIIVEGDKRGAFPKIEVVRAARAATLLPDIEGRVVCVTDVPELPWDGPRFGLEAVGALADFIETQLMGR